MSLRIPFLYHLVALDLSNGYQGLFPWG